MKKLKPKGAVNAMEILVSDLEEAGSSMRATNTA